MGDVIPFRKRPTDNTVSEEPLFTIRIYTGDRNGFSWIIASADAKTQPDAQQLSNYLGDMFLALNPQPPSIFQRLSTFIRHALHPGATE